MRLIFEEMTEEAIENMFGGKGTIKAKMFNDDHGKIMVAVFPKGSSIGKHVHKGSYEVQYVLSGQGVAICNGQEEKLEPGVVHYCPEGSEHTVVNTGDVDMVVMCVVPKTN